MPIVLKQYANQVDVAKTSKELQEILSNMTPVMLDIANPKLVIMYIEVMKTATQKYIDFNGGEVDSFLIYSPELKWKKLQELDIAFEEVKKQNKMTLKCQKQMSDIIKECINSAKQQEDKVVKNLYLQLLKKVLKQYEEWHK